MGTSPDYALSRLNLKGIGKGRLDCRVATREELAMTASVFIGTSVDGFIARPNGDLDFLPEGGGEPTATTSLSPASTRS